MLASAHSVSENGAPDATFSISQTALLTMFGFFVLALMNKLGERR